MYSRQQSSQLRQTFWTRFGQYMSPVLSAEGEKINWINYKTGEKHIHLKMDAQQQSASIGLFMSHKDPELQQLYYELLHKGKELLSGSTEFIWQWQLHRFDDDGQLTSGVFDEIAGVSILRQEDWPQLISFLKPRLIDLDAFWSQVKYGFEALR